LFFWLRVTVLIMAFGGAWISLRVALSVFLIVRGSTGGRPLSLLAIVIVLFTLERLLSRFVGFLLVVS